MPKKEYNSFCWKKIQLWCPHFWPTHNNILALLEQGNSIRKVAAQCGVSKSKIQKIRAKYFLNVAISLGGHPTKLSAQDKHFCVCEITSGYLNAAIEVAKKLKADLYIDVCNNTVCNALREAGLGATKKEAKPKLSPKNIKAHLKFAKYHQD